MDLRLPTPYPIVTFSDLKMNSLFVMFDAAGNPQLKELFIKSATGIAVRLRDRTSIVMAFNRKVLEVRIKSANLELVI